MIKGNIAFSDLEQPPLWQANTLRLGKSWITPYCHSAVETVVVRTQGQWFATVRERCTDVEWKKDDTGILVDADRFNQLYKEALLWPLDYLMIEVAQAGCRLKLRAGLLGSAPVYCRVSDDAVEISYDLADFFSRPTTIDLEMASRRLALSAAYSARQLCSGVLMLTERATLFAEPGKARYVYPSPAETVAPSDEALIDYGMERFGQLLHRAVSIRPASTQVAVELSGGMDSATVACALTRSQHNILSLGILLDQGHSQTQTERRRLLVETLGLRDTAVNIDAFPPTLDLQPSARRPDYPLAEFYLEAFESVWDRAQAQGSDRLFTGVGGDQLFPTYRNEERSNGSRHGSVAAEAKRRAELLLTPSALNASRSVNGFDAPAGPLSASVLASSMCQAPHLLRRGLWPVNPLSDPHLVAFCRGLPLECRQDRETMWRYLRANVGDIFPRDYCKETFAHVLPELIAHHAKTIAMQLSECALADLGLVDRDAVLQLLDELVSTRARPLTAPLISFLWLERFVRQFA
ncbi:asparagine synthase-related protein [Xanthomonas sp. CFBP 8445]|uniref:asparagine synthase-related protein n=1 Tax=Xanthomonas sp. CFBP 8445 TaxID=2971236 RepID=UPI0021DFB125|nr:asparagine synthase-related protein [Xanthomonas sp. CFBP 8445]UYC10722.1 asparagine synthase-related protein [Xanthomonas sp. CFBP 8445]